MVILIFYSFFMDKRKTSLHECCHTGEEVDTSCCCQPSEALQEKYDSLIEEMDKFTFWDKVRVPFWRASDWVKNKYYNVRDFFERGWYGYATGDLCCADTYLTHVILGCVRGVKVGGCCPTEMEEDEWNEVLEKIIEGFKMYQGLEEFRERLDMMSLSEVEYDEMFKKYTDKMYNGMNLFTRHFHHLWI